MSPRQSDTVSVPVMLERLRAAARCEAVDTQLAALLVRRSGFGGHSDHSNVTDASMLPVALATVLISRARREGHSAISLDQLVQQARDARESAPGSIPAELPIDDRRWWERALASSPLVGTGDDDGDAPTPLVLRGDLLQLRRYHDAERRIAERLHAMVTTPSDDGIPMFSIVTGGPGTGKTTLIATQLVERHRSAPGVRVALAAPTGKAAARLTESIALRLAAVNADSDTPMDAPGDARTLHRLLGYSPATDRYRRAASEPLDEDLVIVDEASMVDVLMLDALLRALSPRTRLLLVGDHNQLASVDAGDVLGALCRTALASPEGSPLRESVTFLTKSWRFEQQPAIGTLAAAILAGDGAAVLRVCADPASPDVRLHDGATGTDDVLAPVMPNLERCLAARTPEALLDALDSFRLLAPEREGRMGVQGLNTAVEHWLARRGHAVHEPWYHGRPVLVTANDYATGVYNGDIGVVWRDAGQAAVYFRGAGGTTRAIAPARLPVVETAWAMTVHKAQGSEFDDVILVVPERESRVMNRALLYTAVTRARRRVTIIGSRDAVESAVQRQAGRTSGLAEQLARRF